MVKSLDKRTALQRLQDAAAQNRGTPLTKKDVAEVWAEIVRLRQLEAPAKPQHDEPKILNLAAALAATAELDDEVW